MKLSDYKDLLKTLVENKIYHPILAQGPTGIGKTEVCFQVAEELGGVAFDVRIGQCADTGDIVGFPYKTKDDTMEWAPPKWWEEMVKASKKHPFVMLVWDEINRGPKDVRQCLFQVVEKNEVMGRKLPNNVIQIGLMNPDNGEYQVEELDKAFIRRMCPIMVEPDWADWNKHAEKADIHKDLLGFYSINRSMLYEMEKAELPKRPKSPASVFAANKFVQADIHLKPYGMEVLAGCLGDEVAAAFMKHLQTKAKPVTAEEVFEDGVKAFERFKMQKHDEKSVTIEDIRKHANEEARKLGKNQRTNFWEFMLLLIDAEKGGEPDMVAVIQNEIPEYLHEHFCSEWKTGTKDHEKRKWYLEKLLFYKIIDKEMINKEEWEKEQAEKAKEKK